MLTITIFDTIPLMNVVIAPDRRLRIKTKKVIKITPGLVQTTQAMIKLTKTFKDPEGVGLASTQVGLDGSFFVALDDVKPTKKGGKGKFIIVFNPKIISSSKTLKTHFEGCLSIPNYWGEVKRPTFVKVSFQDQTGKTYTKTLKGLMAHVFQHEVDHLNGVLFPDLVLQQKGRFFKYMGLDKRGQEIYEEVII